MFNKLIFSLFLTVTLLLTGCGGSGEDEKPSLDPIPAPTITSFSSAKTSIAIGESVDLTAVFSNGQGTINKGIGTITSGTATVVTPEETTTYTLTVTNSAGAAVTAELTIEVVFPEIISFTASLLEITEEESTELTAVFANGQGTIDVGVGSVNSGDSKTPPVSE